MAQPQAAIAMTAPMAQLYAELSAALHGIGPFRTEVEKASLQLVRASTFLSVHPRKAHLLLTITSESAIDSPRVLKVEQVAPNRWHVDVKITVGGDIDDELIGWLRNAYELCG